MSYTIRRAKESDEKAVVDIFNYYVENSFAAYTEKKKGAYFFQNQMAIARQYPFYVIEHESGEVIGFAFLGSFHGAHTFDRTAEITYFIWPAHGRKGLGTMILDTLISEARKIGIDTLLAHINSLNQDSIDFHLANGFRECGRFVRVGRKFNKDFDVVWMQKFI